MHYIYAIMKDILHVYGAILMYGVSVLLQNTDL